MTTTVSRRERNVSSDQMKVIWACDDCHSVFIFADDLEFHCKTTAHFEFSAFDIDTGLRLKEKSVNFSYHRL
jgi:hypothetical protein